MSVRQNIPLRNFNISLNRLNPRTAVRRVQPPQNIPLRGLSIGLNRIGTSSAARTRVTRPSAARTRTATPSRVTTRTVNLRGGRGRRGEEDIRLRGTSGARSAAARAFFGNVVLRSNAPRRGRRGRRRGCNPGIGVSVRAHTRPCPGRLPPAQEKERVQERE